MNQCLFVTGAAGDLGSAVMTAAARHGYCPVGFDLVEAPDVQQVDLTSEMSVKHAYAQTAADRGKPVGLVNCVGNYEGLTGTSTSLEEFEGIQTANVTTVWLSCMEFASLCETDARIVNLTSISGQHGSQDVAYGTAKAAVIGLTKSLALSLGSGIRVNAVAPGVMESRMSRRIPEDRAAGYKTSSILGRYGRTEEVAELIITLLGPAADWMTGSIIDINGGIT